MNLPPPDGIEPDRESPSAPEPTESTKPEIEPPARTGSYAAGSDSESTPASPSNPTDGPLLEAKPPSPLEKSLRSATRVIGLLVLIAVSCYLAAALFQVVGSTVTGRDTLPDWPDFSDLVDDILTPGFQLLVVTLIAMVPTIIMGMLGVLEWEEGVSYGMPELVAAICYAVYMPMGVLSVVHFGTVSAALPHRVLPAIGRALPGYWVAAFVLLLVDWTNHLMGVLVGGLPLLGSLVTWAVSIYLLLVSGRVIGLMYRQNRGSIGW
jgi:hypothetical protein